MRYVLVLAAAAALVLPTAAGAESVTYRDAVPQGQSGRVSVTARSAASFQVVLRVPAAGRTQLFLSGAKAPRGGPLIDTRTYGCTRAGATRVCRAAYEALPAGTYTWRIHRVSGRAAPTTLTVRW